MATQPTSLQSAIEQAVETHKEELEQPLEQPKQPEQETEEKPKEEKEAPDEETVMGRALIQALKDPQQAAQIIDTLARQAGYTRDTINTAKDVKEAKTNLTAILEEEFGDEIKFLAPKIASGLEKYLNELKSQPDDRTAILEERVSRQEQRELQTETSQEHARISQAWFGSNDMPQNVIDEMSRAMDKFPPTNPNMSVTEYYNDIFTFVVGKLGLQKKNAAREQKVENNRRDAPARQLTSTNRGATPANNGDGSGKKMSIKESIEAAIVEVDKKMSR